MGSQFSHNSHGLKWYKIKKEKDTEDIEIIEKEVKNQAKELKAIIKEIDFSQNLMEIKQIEVQLLQFEKVYQFLYQMNIWMGQEDQKQKVSVISPLLEECLFNYKEYICLLLQFIEFEQNESAKKKQDDINAKIAVILLECQTRILTSDQIQNKNIAQLNVNAYETILKFIVIISKSVFTLLRLGMTQIQKIEEFLPKIKPVKRKIMDDRLQLLAVNEDSDSDSCEIKISDSHTHIVSQAIKSPNLTEKLFKDSCHRNFRLNRTTEQIYKDAYNLFNNNYVFEIQIDNIDSYNSLRQQNTITQNLQRQGLIQTKCSRKDEIPSQAINFGNHRTKIMFATEAYDDPDTMACNVSYGLCCENSSGTLGFAGFQQNDPNELYDVDTFKIMCTNRSFEWLKIDVNDKVPLGSLILQQFKHEKTNREINYYLARIVNCPYQIIGIISAENGKITGMERMGWIFQQDQKTYTENMYEILVIGADISQTDDNQILQTNQ